MLINSGVTSLGGGGGGGGGGGRGGISLLVLPYSDKTEKGWHAPLQIMYRTYCNLGTRKKNNSNIVWRLNISFTNSLRLQLALINMGGFTCFTIGVAPRSRGVRGNVWSRLFCQASKCRTWKRVWTPVLGEHAHCSKNIPPIY